MEAIASAPTSMGQDIAQFRAEISATQSQLASKSGVDQSRVSRIEKGETGSPSELGKILDALVALGSKGAADYGAYLAKEWQYVERPDFSNPQRNILEMAEESLRQIADFLDQEDRPWPLKRQIERQRAAIEAAAVYLGKNAHQIAFIGEVGVGKSTAISFLYGLIDPTSPPSELRERVVLETGGGHTTLCEVNIRRGPGFGIVVQAQSDEEMRNLVGDFCAATWLRRPGGDGQKNDIVNVSEEVQRALRNMSGLTVRRERDANGKTNSRDQAAELASQCATEEEFRARVIELIKLELRTRREIWIEDGGAKAAMQQLRKLFRDINNGRLGDVPLPASIDLLIPGFGSEVPGLAVSAVDTKGLDEITVRADLDARLKDPRTHVVLCSTFNQAPSTSVQLLLDHLRNAHGVRVDAGKVSVLALPRDDEAMAVKDDSGESPIDDEDGYQMKCGQILRTLAIGDGALNGVPIVFFNAKKDDAAKVRGQLIEQVVRLRESHEERLLNECAAADEVIRHHETQAFTSAVQAVADQLSNFLGAHAPLPPRIRQPLEELIDAIDSIRYASTIWAMTRRNGEYYNFSVSHQVGAGGAKDALLRSKTWFEKLQGVLDTLKQDDDLALAQKTIQQVEVSAEGWRRDFAEAARTAAVEVYRGPLEADVDLWSNCAAQWGAGPGFKVRVRKIIRDWFEAQTDLNQKLEEIMAALWEKSVVRPLEHLSNESAGELSEGIVVPSENGI
ncbi:helix-turn-helix domain-containing protein [Acidithiobacillus ferridurans]|jgi:transcriptional regulator with XRE-family HTH domain|uniref:helix-turn-helix domain-containing protein n=1 Tax=Acidithiobacillus ferridurans TaxID=1232575 RepID=UPI001C06F462|nr:helix-turn-helix domain-containing protein [Acidithiobacillus ferridurans]